jgi:hypothetical protein
LRRMLLRLPSSLRLWVLLAFLLGEKSPRGVSRIIELIARSAVLGSYFLNERLGILGKLGCAMSLLGSVIIVLHAPPDKEIDTVEDILEYAIKPGE